MSTRVLLCTTGREKGLRVFLDSLLSVGNYKGDIVVIDYGDCGKLEYEEIKKIRSTKELNHHASDRFRVFYKYLKDNYTNYDVVILIDGNDIEFNGDINPLIEMAKEKVCYVQEKKLNKQWNRLGDFPSSKMLWTSIKDEHIANSGVIVGPSVIVYGITKYIKEGLVNRSTFGTDQLLFNVLIYHYKIPSMSVSNIWNYDTRGKRKKDIDSSVVILHHIGKVCR